MQPTVGRIVHYQLSRQDAADVNRRRLDFEVFSRSNRAGQHRDPGTFPGRSGHVGHYGATVAEGDVYPALVVRTFASEAGTCNLHVLLDGNDSYWATSRAEGSQPGAWAWPPRS